LVLKNKIKKRIKDFFFVYPQKLEASVCLCFLFQMNTWACIHKRVAPSDKILDKMWAFTHKIKEKSNPESVFTLKRALKVTIVRSTDEDF